MAGKCMVGRAATVTVYSLVVLTAVLHQCCCIEAARAAAPLSKPSNQSRPRSPAVFVFGDSIVDPGNNNAIVTVARCNFPPYGQDFPGHNATGRFSNGRVPGDILASQIGIKQYVPAYLGTQLSDFDLLTGVSFASGACGFDPLTAELAVSTATSPFLMDDQMGLFKEYKMKLKNIAGEQKAAHIISRSLYMVVTGTDDLANTYFTTPFRRNYDLESYIEFMVQCASDFIQKLYSLGARRIYIAGTPPIGCLPSQRTNAGGMERECVSLYNQAAVVYNSQLEKKIQSLNTTLPGAMLTFIDLYTPLFDLIQQPYAYGFEVSNRGCCGTGIFEVAMLCNRYTAHACKDVNKFVFWDTYHLTERAYSILITQIVNRYGIS